MKKLALTIAIVLGISFGSFAQDLGGGLFKYGEAQEDLWYSYSDREGGLLFPTLPQVFGDEGDHTAPLGSGMVVLMGLGAAYLATKKHKK